MRTVTVTAPGGPEVLQLIDTPIPRPGPGQVLVRVQAAAVNPVDIQTRNGTYHRLGWVSSPRVGLGWDLAGVVEEIGPPLPGDADDAGAGIRLGCVVAALHAGVDKTSGACADFAVLPITALAPLPPGLDPVAAATVPLNTATAVQALDLLGPGAGRSLLVTGAAGAVGAYATRLAAERGFLVTGLARAHDEQFVTGLGALHRSVPTHRPAYDAVVDAAALGSVALDGIVDGGSYVGVVPPAVPEPVRGISTVAVMAAADADLLRELLQRTADGGLPARVHDVLPLERVADAHRMLEAGGLRGRVVLRP